MGIEDLNLTWLEKTRLYEGGGGGSSGRMEWPGYMQARHEEWLNEMQAYIPATNPYLGVSAYVPDTYIAAIETQMTNLIALYDSIGTTLATAKTAWEGIATAVQVKLDTLLLSTPTSTFLTLAQAELSGAVVAALDADTIGRFEAGMRDINAVQSSSFTLGKATLYSRVGLELTRLTGEMRLKAITDRNRGVVEGSFQLLGQIAGFAAGRMALVSTYMDKCKLDIIAKKEQLDRQVDLDLEEARWPFFEWQQAGTLLGAIGGPGMGSISKPNPTASTLGGAVTGAAAGYQMSGSYYGAAAGAIIGGLGGYLSSR